METEEEWEALSLNPNQPLITQKVPRAVVLLRCDSSRGVGVLDVLDGRGPVDKREVILCALRSKVDWWRAGSGSEGGASTSPGC